MESMELYGVMAVPLVTGLVQLCTSVGLPKRYAPVISLITGICIGAAGFSSGNTLQGIIVGAAIGLSASGFYSAIRAPQK